MNTAHPYKEAMSDFKLPPPQKMSVTKLSRFAVITTSQVTVSVQFFCFLWSRAAYVALCSVM